MLLFLTTCIKSIGKCLLALVWPRYFGEYDAGHQSLHEDAEARLYHEENDCQVALLGNVPQAVADRVLRLHRVQKSRREIVNAVNARRVYLGLLSSGLRFGQCVVEREHFEQLAEIRVHQRVDVHCRESLVTRRLVERLHEEVHKVSVELVSCILVLVFADRRS